jgi:acyl-CoA thioesterase-1
MPELGVTLSRRGFCLAGLQGLAWTSLSALPLTSQAAATRRLLVMGDSLSAEYGIAKGSGWVALAQVRMARQGMGVDVVNASVSGETTSGGRARLPALLAAHHPTHVVIELGANDALRGLPIAQAQANLEAMIDAAQASGAKVLLIGMMVPPNFGRRYSESFAGMFGELARSAHVSLVPFLLKGVADRPDAVDWFQPDRLHPLAKAHPIILDNVWPALSALLLGRQAGAKVAHQ